MNEKKFIVFYLIFILLVCFGLYYLYSTDVFQELVYKTTIPEKRTGRPDSDYVLNIKNNKEKDVHIENLQKENFPEKEIFVQNFTQEEQFVYDELLKFLNTKTLNYDNYYRLSHEVHQWRGHSGSTDFVDKTQLHVEVKNGELEQYQTKTITGEHFDMKKNEDYDSYYDKSKNKICKIVATSTSKCYPVQMNKPYTISEIYVNKIIGRHDGRPLLVCGDDKYYPSEIMKFPCPEKIQWINKSLKFGHQYYNRETKEGLCFYSIRDENTRKISWAAECQDQRLELNPIDIHNTTPLKNVICERYGHTSCTCSFDPVKSLECNDPKPMDIDSLTKNGIIKMVSYNNIFNITKEETNGKILFKFYIGKYENQVLINSSNSYILKATYGKSIREQSYTDVDITDVSIV